MVKVQDTIGEANGDGAPTWTGSSLCHWVALPLDRAHPELSCCPSLPPRRPHGGCSAPMRPATTLLVQHTWGSTG